MCKVIQDKSAKLGWYNHNMKLNKQFLLPEDQCWKTAAVTAILTKQLEVNLQIIGALMKNNSSNTRAISKRYTLQNHFQRVFMIFQGTLTTAYY